MSRSSGVGDLPVFGRVMTPSDSAVHSGIWSWTGCVRAVALGTVTGFCFNPDDIDVATVFTATIAHRMTVVRGPGR